MDAIKRGKDSGAKFKSDITVLCPIYKGVGKVDIKQLKVSEKCISACRRYIVECNSEHHMQYKIANVSLNILFLGLP